MCYQKPQANWKSNATKVQINEAHLFNIKVAMNGGSQRLGKDVKNVTLLLGKLFALLHILSYKKSVNKNLNKILTRTFRQVTCCFKVKRMK